MPAAPMENEKMLGNCFVSTEYSNVISGLIFYCSNNDEIITVEGFFYENTSNQVNQPYILIFLCTHGYQTQGKIYSKAEE